MIRKFNFKIQDGKMLMSELTKDEIKRHCSYMKDGEYFLGIDKITDKRSNSQNRYYWGVIVKILSQELGYDQDEIHEILKYKFNPANRTIGDETLTIGNSTTKLNTMQFNDFLDSIIRWAVSLNIVIPEPGEYLDSFETEPTIFNHG